MFALLNCQPHENTVIWMSFTTALLCPSCPGERCPCRFSASSFSLFTAAEQGRLPLVMRAINGGKNPSTEDKGGYTPLHYAGMSLTFVGGCLTICTAQHNRVDVVKFLLYAGANKNANSCGATPLHRAAFSGSTFPPVSSLRC